jgi:hypothetical protein
MLQQIHADKSIDERDDQVSLAVVEFLDRYDHINVKLIVDRK